MINNFSCIINVSSDSLSEIPWIVNHPDDLDFDTIGNGYAVAVIVSFIFLMGVPWNLFVICAIIKKRLYSEPIIMLMLNLAITNLLLCILVMPFNIVSGIASEYVFGESDLVRCRVCQTGVAVIILPWVSIHTLCLQSIDRFIYLKWPLRYSEIVTPRCTLVAIISTWVLCIAISIPPLLGFGEIRFSYVVATCVLVLVGSTHIAPNYHYTMLLLAEVIVPIITLFVLYFWIMCIVRSTLIKKLKRVMRVASDETERRNSLQQHSANQLHLVKLFGAIFTANLVTWLPVFMVALTGAIVGAKRIPTVAYSIAYLSYLSETVIHAVMAALLISKLKKTLSEVVDYFRNKLCKFKRSNWNSTSTTVTVDTQEKGENGVNTKLRTITH